MVRTPYAREGKHRTKETIRTTLKKGKTTLSTHKKRMKLIDESLFLISTPSTKGKCTLCKWRTADRKYSLVDGDPLAAFDCCRPCRRDQKRFKRKLEAVLSTFGKPEQLSAAEILGKANAGEKLLKFH